MEILGFNKIKAIDETRAKKIIEWYEKTRYDVAIGTQGPGITLGWESLIELLTVFGNSKNIEKDFRKVTNDAFRRSGEMEAYQLGDD